MEDELNKPRKYKGHPKWLSSLFALLYRGPDLQEIQEDLIEAFVDIRERQGYRKARLYYFKESLKFIVKSIFSIKGKKYNSKSNQLSMLTNYLKTSGRNFRKHKYNSIINLAGLIGGITSALLIIVHVNAELNYDQIHSQGEKIFRVNLDIISETGKLQLARTSGPFGPQLKENYPEIREAVRISNFGNPRLVRQRELSNYEENILYADAAYFKLFDFGLVVGNPNVALSKPFQVVITQEIANKYFADQPPVGQIISIQGQEHIVTGIVEGLPQNTQLKFDFLVSMQTLETLISPVKTNWFWYPVTTFLLFDEKEDAERFDEKLIDFRDRYMVNPRLSQEFLFSLENFKEIHFNPYRQGELGTKGNKVNLFFLSLVASFIVMLAVANFVNLTTAKSSVRIKEIGVRKTLGGSRRQISIQFISEGIFFITLSFVFAFLIFYLILPEFKALMDYNYDISFLFNLRSLILIALGILFTGIISGLYPSMIMARINPVAILGNRITLKGGGAGLRKVLTIFQFCISSALIITAFVMWIQIDYMKTFDTGIRKDKTLIVEFGPSGDIMRSLNSLKNQWLQRSNVLDVSFSSHIPGDKPHGVGTQIGLENGSVLQGEIEVNLIDFDYFEDYGIELIAGRYFSPQISGDTMALILNEKAVQEFGFSSASDAIGLDFLQWGRSGKVIGVVKDFNYQSLHTQIAALSFQVWPQQFRKASIKFNGEIPSAIRSIEEIWKANFPAIPFDYYLLEDHLTNLYKEDFRFGRLISAFTVLAICIAGLGLLALTSFICQRKAKEFAIKKVLGAASPTLIMSLIYEFAMPIAIAFIIAIYPAYFFTSIWLNDYAYKIELGLIHILLPLLITILIVVISVLSKSLRTIWESPIMRLKNE